MSRSLILLGEHLDNLWSRYIPEKNLDKNAWSCSDSFETLNLKSPHSHQPHYHDILGWRRWLKGRQIRQILFYHPSTLARVILTAAAISDIDIHLRLTGRLDSNLLREIKLWAPKIKTFNCAGHFIAQLLCRANLPSHQITVNSPEVAMARPDHRRLEPLRRRIKTEPAVPVVLALIPPHNHIDLKPLVWSTAIVRHVLGNLRLVVAGHYSAPDKTYLDNLQQTMDAQGMIHLEDDSTNWDDLVGISDVVLSGSVELYDVMRLLHARAAQKPIVAVRGDSDEFLADYPPARLLKSPDIRPLAAALLTCLEKTTIALTIPHEGTF